MATRIKSSQIADGAIVAADLHSAIAVSTTSSGTFGSVIVDTITIDAAAIATTANMTLDSGSDIILDADGGNIMLKDDTVWFGNFNHNGNNLAIDAKIADGSIVFRGTDGSTPVTALTLDMSNAGRATFNENVNVGGDLTITGDLTVEGTSVTLNTTALDVEDKNITLNYHASNDTSASADGAGITIQDAVDASTDASILWDATNDKFSVSHSIEVTGTLTSAGPFTVTGTNGNFTIAANGNDIYYGRNGANYHIAGTANGAFNFLTGASSTNRFKIASNGDIGFYEDNNSAGGGTPAIGMHWDYADGRLGIGSSSICTDPQWELVVGSGVTGATNGQIFVDATIDGTGDGITIDGDGRSANNGALFLIIDKDNNIAMDVGTTGNVAIGSSVSATAKLHVKRTDTHSGQRTIYADGTQLSAISTSGTNYLHNVWIENHNFDIDSGVTDSGYRIGLNIEGYHDSNVFEGTLATQKNIWSRNGNNTNGTGTITDSYNLHLDTLSGGGMTITNNWGLYQTGSGTKNYFEGNLGIGVNPTNAKLEVVSASGEVFRADAASGAYRIIANQDDVLLQGDVGIGTLDPKANFQVMGPSSATVPGSGTGAVGGSIFSADLNTYGMHIGSITSGKGYIQQQRTDTETYYDILLQPNGGKVGVGGAEYPTGKLTIANATGTSAPSTITASNTYLHLGGKDYGPNNNGKFMIGFGFTDGTTNTNSPAYIGYEEGSTSGDTYGDLTFYTRSVYTDTAPSERLRIGSGGAIRVADSGSLQKGMWHQHEYNSFSRTLTNTAGAEEWIRLFEFDNPFTGEVSYGVFGNNFEETGIVEIGTSWTSSNLKLNVTRQTYQHVFEEFRLASPSSGANYELWARISIDGTRLAGNPSIRYQVSTLVHNNGSSTDPAGGIVAYRNDQPSSTPPTNRTTTVLTANNVTARKGQLVQTADNGTYSAIFETNSDSQIRLKAPSTAWAGINFMDDTGSENIFYRGSSATFSIGGGGSTTSGKKLHIDGGTTIGSSLDNTTMPTDGLLVETQINIGENPASPDGTNYPRHILHIGGTTTNPSYEQLSMASGSNSGGENATTIRMANVGNDFYLTNNYYNWGTHLFDEANEGQAFFKMLEDGRFSFGGRSSASTSTPSYNAAINGSDGSISAGSSLTMVNGMAKMNVVGNSDTSSEDVELRFIDYDQTTGSGNGLISWYQDVSGVGPQKYAELRCNDDLGWLWYKYDSTNGLTNVASMDLDGNFSAASKSFDIEHPTKEGMRLHHGSLEGPEHGVYIRGKLKDSNVIELPEYWTGLVDEDTITVQLTAIGAKQDLWVESIENNTVNVGGENVNCFYFIQAERKDVDKFDVEYKA